MTMSEGPAPDAPTSARPYGLIGLVISIPIILGATLVFCVASALLAFALFGLFVGWHPAMARLDALRVAISHDDALLQRLGIIASIVLYVALSASVLLGARLRGGKAWRDLIGWRAWHGWRRSRLFWITLIGAMIYNVGASALVSHLYPESKDWVTLPKGALWVTVFVALAAVFAPIAEELFFRGWLYTSLRRSIGLWAAVLLTSVVFALAHWEKTHIYALAVFPVGIALALIREKAESLKASITFHALYNASAAAIVLFTSGS